MDLSPEIVRWLTSLRMYKFKGEPRPHKPILLLAVLELAENGQLPTNEVHLDPTLAEYFGDYWKAVTSEPTGRIQYPFWFMDSEPFWDLVMQPEFEGKQANKRYPPSGKQISEWVRFARLDDRLFEALGDATTRDRIRGVIVSTYFPERTERVAEIRQLEASIYQYTQIIRWSVASGEAGVAYAVTPEFVRDAAFRRVVTGAYDYTCAVSGARLTMSAGGTYQLVQAAHIHDWAKSRDDNPRNGIALSPNYHWLFERGLFTLEPQWRVRVSPAARDCVGTVDVLLTPFRGQRVRLPADESLWPGQDYLDWHRREKYLDG